MNTNELIPFNWDEYQKGGWEAVVCGRVVTEVSSPDNQGAHFFKTSAGIWNWDIVNIRMSRKLRDAWVVVWIGIDGEYKCINRFFFDKTVAILNMDSLLNAGLQAEIHHIKTAL